MIKTYKISQVSIGYKTDGGAIFGVVFDKLVEAGFSMTYRDEIFLPILSTEPITRYLTDVTITLKSLSDLTRLISIVGGIMISDITAPEENICYGYQSRLRPRDTILIYDEYYE